MIIIARIKIAIHLSLFNININGSFEIATKQIEINSPIIRNRSSFKSTMEIIRINIHTNLALGSKLCMGDFKSAYLSISK
jgi:hypothetical protein